MIFISHSTNDDKFVDKLASELHIYGIQTWVDHQDMPIGSRWVTQLEEALGQSDVLLLVLSQVSLKSSYVESEWHTFFNMGRKIIPLMLEKCEIPLFLRTFHQIDFQSSHNFEEQVKQLLAVLPYTIEKTSAHQAQPSWDLPDTLSKKPEPSAKFPSHAEILDLAQELLESKAVTMRQGMIQLILPIDGTILQYPLQNELIIGRSHQTVKFQADIDLRPYQYSCMVSRRHASLSQSNKTLFIKDNNSSNGTYIGESRIIPEEYYPLENYSLVYLSQHFPIMIRYQF